MQLMDPLYIRKMDTSERRKFLFDSLRAQSTENARAVLSLDGKLASQMMHGYEGSDIYADIIGGNGRCYTYTGQEKDGFFYPLHVAAEAGSKECVQLLIKDFDVNCDLLDYREITAEAKCAPGQPSRHAFFEMRGMFFEMRERYQGGTNKLNGVRHGQGILFHKPEGYEHAEKVLYRGTFKDNVYHGQGALYWPGSDVLQYKGRYKAGVKHGRGILFDDKGHKIYQGTFRDDKKDGRGELFEATEGRFSRTYHGDFENDMMHGFGVAYYDDAGTFVGRFENGMKAGVGVYVYPNGDRFEGMFFADKPDGKGSYYTPTADGKGETGSHFIWQNGRKSSQVEAPFAPDKLDLPDPNEKDVSNIVMNAIINSDDASVSSLDTIIGKKEADTGGGGGKRGDRGKGTSERRSSTTSQVSTKRKGDPTVSKAEEVAENDWKMQLGRAVRIMGKTAKLMGMEDPVAVAKAEAVAAHKMSDASANLDEAEDEEEASSDEEEPDMDDIIGPHFLTFVPVFTAYVYVCAASKVFEGRTVSEAGSNEAGRENAPMIVPDFDAVSHLVMDAIEDYNDAWEKAYAAQREEEDTLAEAKKHLEAEEEEKAGKGHGDNHGSVMCKELNQADAAGVVSKLKANKLFMTEAEKRQELKRKQRADLSAKKGGGTLNKETEQSIGFQVYHVLEKELQELTSDDINTLGDDFGAPRTRPGYQRYGVVADNDDGAEAGAPAPPSNEFATELLYLLRMARGTM